MKRKRIITSFLLTAALTISSIMPAFAMNDASASATGTYGTMPWSASAKCSSNMFTAKLVTNYYCNSVKVTTTVTYTMGSNRAQTVNMSSGICTQTATTDVYGKRISVAGYTVNSMYSKNYIYGELCKTLTIV
ncbi:MAG: hypothetical protein ACLR6A_04785 [Candidatus Gastranaerophilaceae bacterium]